MKSNFDKSLCLSNIYYLAKLKNVKIGDLENKAGVSAGYLSRLNKEDNTSSPSIECITSMAAELQVSLDVLVGVDLQSITKTEEYIICFIEKVTRDTDDGVLVWDKESAQQLNNLNWQRGEDHPLFYPPYDEDGNAISDDLFYQPVNKDLETVTINNPCFHAELCENTTIYIMSTTANGITETILDIYLVDNGRNAPLCSTENYNPAIALAIRTLYEHITESTKHAQLRPEVKEIIECYLEGKKRKQKTVVTFDEEIPF